MKRYIVLIALLVAMAACKDAVKWIASYGYTSIVPPSTLLQPGAMIMKKRFNRAGTRIVCSAEESLGAHFVPSQSKTVTGKFTKVRKTGWNVGADALEQIHVNTNSDAVSDVYVTVNNARIVTLTDTDVLKNLKYRSDACQRALAKRQSAGADISIVSSALVADVSYQVKFQTDANIDVSAKLAQMQQVAITLGGNIQSITEDEAQATGLVWGIQDSMYLGAIGLDDVDVKALRRKSLLLPSDVLAPATSHAGAFVSGEDASSPSSDDESEQTLFCPTEQSGPQEQVPDETENNMQQPGPLPTAPAVEGQAPDANTAPVKSCRVPPHLR